MKKLLEECLLRMQFQLKVQLKRDDTVDFYAEMKEQDGKKIREVGIKVNGNPVLNQVNEIPANAEITDEKLAALDDFMSEQLLIETFFFFMEAALQSQKPKSKIITSL